MALFFPPAASISRFVGGYKSLSDYTDLADTETNDALNVFYGPDGDLSQRNGSVKLLNARLTSVATPTVGEPITGHYFFKKLGDSGSYHIVAAGDSIFQYTSSTASTIATGMTDNSNTFFQFAQIQDPRSAGDDLMLATNGVDPIKVWNGSASMINLSAMTSATSVPLSKYIINHKNKIYLLNVNDSTDTDAEVKVVISEIGTDGAPNPHRFVDEFYCGGSDQSGDIRGRSVLNDQLVIYARKGIWKFTAGSGRTLDTNNLQQVQGAVGLYAPFSLVSTGQIDIFLSERGVQVFDGVNQIHISEDVDDVIFEDSNLGQLEFAKAILNEQKNQYILYFPGTDSNRNNRALVYDLRLKHWQPPITGRQVSYISKFFDSNDVSRVIYGDYRGYLYQDDTGLNNGINTGYNGTVDSATVSSVFDSDAGFSTASDGLSGLMVRIYSGQGEGQERVIASNTSATLQLESDFTTPPNSASLYTVAGINAYWRSKDYDLGGHDIVKLFRTIYVRVREEGDFDLNLDYIIDFKALLRATRAQLRLIESGFAWGVGRWGEVVWGDRRVFKRKVSLRNTNDQRLNGTHMAVRFSNERANESFKISGFDIVTKAIGKR